MLIKKPVISVIIPSHNRILLLRQVLDALVNQTFPAEEFEVIVVLDGCSDGSNDMLREFSAPFPLHFIEQEQKGSSEARNRGADQAVGELLLFLDDDIEPAPRFITAHVNAHHRASPMVVIGYSPARIAQNNFLSLEIQGWWETMFRSMKQPDHRFSFTDMLSGNFSISRDVFLLIGGFNLFFSVHEDYEFGVRLIQAGITFAFEPKALGIHHEKAGIERPLHRKYQEGIADIQLGRMYPELISNLLITRLIEHSLLPSKILFYLTFKSPKVAEWIATRALKLLVIFERARVLGVWRKIVDGLLGYWYWKGVTRMLTTRSEVDDFVSGNSHHKPVRDSVEIDLDLSQGVDQAEQVLEHTRPNAARIYYGKSLIGCIPAQGGAERLRGSHLRPFLIDLFVKLMHDGKAVRKVPRLPVNVEEIISFLFLSPLPSEQEDE